MFMFLFQLTINLISPSKVVKERESEFVTKIFCSEFRDQKYSVSQKNFLLSKLAVANVTVDSEKSI